MTATAGTAIADGEILEVYVEATESPIAGGRWEILAGDSVRYVRPDGSIELPAIISATTLRTSPAWRLSR